MSISKFIEQIECGMQYALFDTGMFLETFATRARTEYLITVNIAQRLSTLGSRAGGDPNLRIRLESKTKDFATACVPFSRTPQGTPLWRGKTIRRMRKNTRRNGRIDIALFDKSAGAFGSAIGAIEVKGFRPSKRSVIDDLQRNAEYFLLSDATGTSNISFAAFCALWDFPDTRHVDEIPLNEALVHKHFSDIVRKQNLPASIEWHVLVKTQAEELAHDGMDEDTYQSLDPHHHVGVIVLFTPRGTFNPGINSEEGAENLEMKERDVEHPRFLGRSKSSP